MDMEVIFVQRYLDMSHICWPGGSVPRDLPADFLRGHRGNLLSRAQGRLDQLQVGRSGAPVVLTNPNTS